MTAAVMERRTGRAGGNGAETDFSGRWRFLLLLMVGAMLVLVARAMMLQVMDRQFLQQQGDLRHLSVVPVPAYRGRILDRNGELLAISTPVKSLWVNPREFEATPEQFAQLAELTGLSQRELQKKVNGGAGRQFAYLARRISPELAQQVTDLDLPGIYAEREYRRYYPSGEVTAHLLGVTSVDDVGQEGLELAYNESLRGVPGARRIMRDGKRRIIEDIDSVREPVPGHDLKLTIDQRMQYLAYRELKKAVIQHQARSGSLVLLDSRSGEVLAMVNQPSYNPNSRESLKPGVTRNRALTDVYEPGSTVKPFAVAAALELNTFSPETMINTASGKMMLGSHVITDVHAYGMLNMAGVLQKSSNVGVSRIALSVPPEKFWAFFNNLGFGQPLESGFPGEAVGRMPVHHNLRPFEQATLSFGYGLSSSTLQLARAYAALANQGVMPFISLVDTPERREQPVMSARTASQVRNMLEMVVSREGTAMKASVPGFRIAGKTGTVKKSVAGGYAESQYLALFAGMAPASDPRLVMVVMLDEPSNGEYYGGAVAAPVFSSVMEGALRIMGIAPDQMDGPQLRTAAAAVTPAHASNSQKH